MRFTPFALLAGIASCQHIFSHAILKVAPGAYEKLDQDFRDWFESKQESDMATNKHVTKQEVEGQQNAALVFIDSEGKEAETLFVGYIPVSMTKELIRDKKWQEEKKSEDL